MDDGVKHFQYRPTQLISLELFDICQRIRIVLNATQTITYFMLVYIVWKKCPRSMGAYKWYILINSSHSFLFGFTLIFFQHYVYAPYIGFVLFGFFRYINASPLLTYCALNLAFLAAIGIAYTTTIAFVFRYAQTTGSRHIHLLSNFCFYFLGYLIFQTCMFLFILTPLNTQIMFANETKAAFKGVDEKLYTLIKDEPLVYALNTDTERYSWIAGISFVLTIITAMVIILICSWKTYTSLRVNHRNLHPHTRVMYAKLLIMLIVDVTVTVLVLGVPIFAIVVGQILQLENESTIVTIAFICPEIYPLSVNSILIFYIRPFREGFFEMSRRIFCLRKPAESVKVLSRVSLIHSVH